MCMFWLTEEGGDSGVGSSDSDAKVNDVDGGGENEEGQASAAANDDRRRYKSCTAACTADFSQRNRFQSTSPAIMENHVIVIAAAIASFGSKYYNLCPVGPKQKQRHQSSSAVTTASSTTSGHVAAAPAKSIRGSSLVLFFNRNSNNNNAIVTTTNTTATSTTTSKPSNRSSNNCSGNNDHGRKKSSSAGSANFIQHHRAYPLKPFMTPVLQGAMPAVNCDCQLIAAPFLPRLNINEKVVIFDCGCITNNNINTHNNSSSNNTVGGCV